MSEDHGEPFVSATLRDATECNMQHVSREASLRGQAPAGPEVGPCDTSGLSVQQLQAVTLLSRGYGIGETADKLGVNRTTLFRWRQLHPAFERELRKRTQVELSTLASRCRGLLMRATQRAELALDGHGDRDLWADRVLRNRKLWDLATSAAADEEGEAFDEPRR